LASNEPKTALSCQAAEAIQAKDDAFAAEIGKVEKRRDELLIPRSGAAQRLTAAQLKLADDRLKFQITQIQARQEKYYAMEDLT
ncbi:hypothetical protein CVH10_23070, partial [Halomonas sp. ND22Bw]|uniref:hypothetical protein n=1 Tax=Halomonas sp. ND22Bw TaxID=2054178 RepID=UPI000D2A39C3